VNAWGVQGAFPDRFSARTVALNSACSDYCITR